jgi:hypothetical protein
MNDEQTRGIGDNRPPEAAYRAVVERLASEYLSTSIASAELVELADKMPETVDDEQSLQRFSNVIVALRDAIARAEGARVAEKEDYLRSGQAVDGFFGGIKERLSKAMNALHRRVGDYQNRKLAVERERRRLEAEQRARDAEEARDREERARREAEEARLAALRARLPATREEKAAIASEAEGAASQAAAAAAVAAASAEEARIETMRKASEIARSRFEEGRLVTMKSVPFVQVVDFEQLDAARLWPFVPPEAKERALKTWAKSTGYARAMNGAVIEMRDEPVVR